LGWFAPLLLCFLYSANFGNVFSLSLVHTMEVSRYSTVQMFFTILGQFLAIVLILEVLLGSRDEPDGSAPRS